MCPFGLMACPQLSRNFTQMCYSNQGNVGDFNFLNCVATLTGPLETEKLSRTKRILYADKEGPWYHWYLGSPKDPRSLGPNPRGRALLRIGFDGRKFETSGAPTRDWASATGADAPSRQTQPSFVRPTPRTRSRGRVAESIDFLDSQP